MAIKMILVVSLLVALIQLSAANEWLYGGYPSIGLVGDKYLFEETPVYGKYGIGHPVEEIPVYEKHGIGLPFSNTQHKAVAVATPYEAYADAQSDIFNNYYNSKYPAHLPKIY
uniref:Brownie n=1 Tax=Blattella germanica TaxID=6973 RepID=C6H199_BLAGE|nr:Brownie [Blattella germanica]